MKGLGSYDNDVTTWSPDGNLLQLEFACEAMTQGSVLVGVTGKGVGVLGAVMRRPHELAGYQKKILKLDNHIFMGFSGLSADARKMHKQMQKECLDHRYFHGLDQGEHPSSLAAWMGSENQWKTMFSGGRPVGVGILLLGIKDGKVSLNSVSPTGENVEYTSFAIGKRSQSARTYLEKHLKDYKEETDLSALIAHALNSLNNCRQQETDDDLNSENTVLAVVSKNKKTLIQGDDLAPFLESLKKKDTKEDEDAEMEDTEQKDKKPE